MYIIGIDPGPIPGIVRLQLDVNWVGITCTAFRVVDAQALQVTPGVLTAVLDAIADGVVQALAYERFVVGRRAARSSTPAAGAITREMIGALELWASRTCNRVHTRSAADVKPWAVDKRLHAAGLLDLTAGMRHARDAARHALFCAVRDYGLPDPLSSKAGVR
jgi:hypothetical protein